MSYKQIIANWVIMKSALFMNGKKCDEAEFSSEAVFEDAVCQNFKTLFGENTIYFDLKSKVDTKTLGSTIPDGFLFDFKDVENPEFYLVEVELQKHDFYRHIFPQITKFFAFFKNSKSRNNLIERLFTFIKSNPEIKKSKDLGFNLSRTFENHLKQLITQFLQLKTENMVDSKGVIIGKWAEPELNRRPLARKANVPLWEAQNNF